jgi:hypothetical protein
MRLTYTNSEKVIEQGSKLNVCKIAPGVSFLFGMISALIFSKATFGK